MRKFGGWGRMDCDFCFSLRACSVLSQFSREQLVESFACACRCERARMSVKKMEERNVFFFFLRGRDAASNFAASNSLPLFCSDRRKHLQLSPIPVRGRLFSAPSREPLQRAVDFSSASAITPCVWLGER